MKTRSYQRIFFALFIPVIIIVFISATVIPPQKGSVPTTINDFFFPGSQPLESGTFANPSQCSNCHGGYDVAVEPTFTWQGSMMAQAQRDPLYLACLAIANQDAPEVGDLCIKCHTPKGWLEGRSEPTDGSALTVDDRQGITCIACHKMLAPTPVGVNPYPNDPLYNAQPGNKASAFTIDQAYLTTIADHIPPANANGMYVCDDQDERRGPYFDPPSNHNTPYSPYHSEAKFCGTCHDVSNPVYSTVKNANGDIIGYTPNDFDTPAPDFSPYAMFPVERTYSEWLMSEYNTPAGVSGTYFGGNKSFVSTCQDCHMRDVTGKGCNKSYAPIRDDLAMHDLTGGNTFIPTLIDLVYPGEADTVALNAGILRARDMLQHAATLELTVDQMNSEVIVKVTNETGHKLPSGYPEGRRIWINIQAFNSVTAQAYESGYYNPLTGILDKVDTKIYEIQPGLTPTIASLLGLTPGHSFHFVLSDTIYFDNRIPPRGFTNANFEAIQSPPVGYSYVDGQYWDETVYQLPFIPDSVDVKLFYQTTTKEYIEFLRDENVTNNAGQLMFDLWDQNGKSPPEEMNNVTWSGQPVHFTTLDLHVFLEGPFEGTTMKTDLVDKGILPLDQPYNVSPWNYSGGESILSVPNINIVDWVMVELRETTGDASTATSSTIVAQKALFLLNDGSIVDTNGISLPEFDVSITDNLFVVIWHRNHLGIMSSIPVVITGGNYTYDYSTGDDKVYGGMMTYKEIAADIWGMVGADGDASGQINIADKNIWMAEVGLSGYYMGDFNLDTQSDNKDKNDIWIENVDVNGQVPDNLIAEEERIPEIIYRSYIPK